ncbi:trypsin-like cysteine/serine peptidase domain-containing protein [Annulohypoxylon moriforme]|nr:trypsin-like cysteine/serine peptidase domain-containing protein [Annulohypoxylon moriforme]
MSSAPEKISFLAILRSASSVLPKHPVWPQLQDRFRAAQLFLGVILFYSKGKKEILEDTELQQSVKSLYNIIGQISTGTDCFLEDRETVDWDEPDFGSDMETAITSIVQAEKTKHQLKAYKKDQFKGHMVEILASFDSNNRMIDFIVEKLTKVKIRAMDPIEGFPQVVFWRLGSPKTNLPTTSFQSDPDTLIVDSSYEEAVLNRTAPRRKVTSDDLEKNPSLKAIVKLFLKFRKGNCLEEYVATGFMVGENIVATAGHCLDNDMLGQVYSVEVRAGYGLPSMTYQSGKGVHAAVHWGWYTGFDRRFELGFIILEESFEGVTPIACAVTPTISRNMPIQVAGFPTDLPADKKMKGHVMHISECRVTCDLDQSHRLLEYELDTYGGNSGSPIIDKNGNAIAIHCGWAFKRGDHGERLQINQGAIIEGHGKPNDMPTTMRLVRKAQGEKDKGVVSEEIGLTNWGSTINLLRLWQ